MDLKPYAGKDVWIQFKAGEQWMAVHAEKSGAIAVSTIPHPQHPDEPMPVPLPAINAHISDDGIEAIVKGNNGGVVAIRFNPDVIHSVVREIESPSILITPESPLVS